MSWGAHDLSPTSAALDAYDRAVAHDNGNGVRNMSDVAARSAKMANNQRKPRKCADAQIALDLRYFPLWPLPRANKAAPAIRAIRRWSSNWTNAALRSLDPPQTFACVNRGPTGPPFHLRIKAGAKVRTGRGSP